MSFREFKSHTFRKGNFVSLVSPSFKKKVDRYKALKKKLRDGSLMAERSPDKRVEKVRIFPVAQNVERHDKEKEVTQQLSDFKNFIRHNNDFKFSPEVEVVKQLIPGSYEILKDEWGKLFIQKIGIDVEQFVKLSDSNMVEIFDLIEKFLSEETKQKFKQYGLLYKRGTILHGPPGTGKTTLVNQVIDLCTKKKDMITFLNPNPYFLEKVLPNIRAIEGFDRPVLVVWEEFETWARHHEGAILNLLDGINQFGNIYYLATTNFLDQVPERIKNRPSRFADIVEIGYPNNQTRFEFLKSKLPASYDIHSWVEKTNGMSIDHLKDLVISVLILNIPFEKALDKVKQMNSTEEQDKAIDRQIANIDDYVDEV